MNKLPGAAKSPQSSNRKVDPTIVVAVITVVGTIMAALLASPVLIALIQKTPSPTDASSSSAAFTPPTVAAAPEVTTVPPEMISATSAVPASEAVVTIIPLEGTPIYVSAESFEFYGGCSQEGTLPLQSGITILFRKIKSLEIVDINNRSDISLDIIMLDGREVTDKMDHIPASACVFRGETDPGQFEQSIYKIKRIEFPW